MQQEHPIDTLNDDPDTWSHNWNYEQSDRLMAFEILKRTVLHETRVPLSSEDLYDKIGGFENLCTKVNKIHPK